MHRETAIAARPVGFGLQFIAQGDYFWLKIIFKARHNRLAPPASGGFLKSLPDVEQVAYLRVEAGVNFYHFNFAGGEAPRPPESENQKSRIKASPLRG